MPSQTQSDIIATLSSCALSDIDAVLTPGECNVMLAFVDDAARNLSDLEALRAKIDAAKGEVPERFVVVGWFTPPCSVEWAPGALENRPAYKQEIYTLAASGRQDGAR